MNTSKLQYELTVIIPALNEADCLAILLPQIHEVLASIKISYQIIVVDEFADEKTCNVTRQNGAILLSPKTQGYGNAVKAGFEYAKSAYIATMDADLSHPPVYLREMWKSRKRADVLIASRYIRGGKAEMPINRLFLSRILNIFFSRGLDLKVRDMSSGYRIYASQVVKNQSLVSTEFDILQELLVKALCEGYRIEEIPFFYRPRRNGSSHARIFKFGQAYLRTFRRLWKLRNSIASADYDARAYDSIVPPQRYWQRQRYKHIASLVNDQEKCLDVGCGSSRILGALSLGSIGLDIQMRKLRYAKRHQHQFVQGSGITLPFRDEAFPCVICSQVIEHLPKGEILNELDRVLQEGGKLILGTPDYEKWQWNITEWLYGKILPQAYADEHITHYTYQDLINEFVLNKGYRLEASHYILEGELILALRKPMNHRTGLESDYSELLRPAPVKITSF